MAVHLYKRGIYLSVAAAVSLASCATPDRSAQLPPVGERGDSPWVFRSVLDNHPRMVTFALSKKLWAAYDTQTAALYKVWRDGVDFDGAVYTTRHGPQPSATGSGYIVNDIPQPWRVIDYDGEKTPEIQYLGHRFSNGRAYLRYALRYGEGRQIEIEELPEAVAGIEGAPGFLRQYTIVDNPHKAKVVQLVAVQSLKSAADVRTNGKWSIEKQNEVEGALSIHGRLELRPDTTQLIAIFGQEPVIAPPPKAGVSHRGVYLMEKSDCSVCHNKSEQTIGPALDQIAYRYKNTPTTVSMLAQKIISGGSGAWGSVPMSPHPTLSLDESRTIVRYILGLDKADVEGLDLGASTATAELPTNIPKGMQSGVALQYYDIADRFDGLPVIERNQLPNKTAIASNIQFTSYVYLPGDRTFEEFKEKHKFVLHASGSINIPETGEYGFRLLDGNGDSRLFFDSRKVIETHGSNSQEQRIRLTAGWHPFFIEYASSPITVKRENREIFTHQLAWLWRPPGKEEAFVPQSVLASAPISKEISSGPKSYVLMPSSEIPGDRSPLSDVHPAFKLVNIRPESFKPKVAGMDFLPDGRLVVSTWSADGGVYILDGVQGDSAAGVKVKQIASGLAEPLGLKVVDNRIFVLQKQELTELIDRDGDEIIDDYPLVSNNWRVTPNFHEFAFGLLYENGGFYATLASAIMPGGAPAQPQAPDRGKVVRIDRKTGAVETVARGLRTPNGIGFGVDGEKFIADNQGNWLPASKIVHVQPGAFYGFREVDPAHDKDLPETQPVVWLPQDEIGNSPSNPAPFNVGIYAGQMLHGDVTHGGLKRVFVEKIDGAYQGCVFPFTQGMEAGVNRIVWGPDGALYVGGIGNPGNWGHEGKLSYGLQKLAPSGQDAFEMLAVRIKANGIEVEFTEPLRPGDGLRPEDYDISQWRYVPTKIYGGPKVDEETLPVRSVRLSPDRRRAFLELQGMKPRHVVYVHLATPFVDAANRESWATESWCTVNAIPADVRGEPGSAVIANTLTAEERAAGWKLLFDGRSTQGWRNFNKRGLDRRWRVQEDSLMLFAKGGGDIVSEQQFENFELSYEWKIAPGGNSGVFFGVQEGKYDTPWRTGPEMQVLDDDAHPDGRLPSHRAGANYDLHIPKYSATKPVGSFNAARLVVNRGHVEHWLNGRKVVEYDIGSDDWKKRLAASKFASLPDYARITRGHLAIQDHGDQVWYRNIKIRTLP